MEALAYRLPMPRLIEGGMASGLEGGVPVKVETYINDYTCTIIYLYLTQ